MAVHAPFRMQIMVTGMTCQHCAMSVSEEIRTMLGVSAVDVRLDSGLVTVLADRELGATELAAAVAVAGFELAG